MFPESFKDTPALKDFKSVESLGEAFVALKQYQGSSIRIPGEDAGTDQMKEFHDKLAGVKGVMMRPDFNDSEQSTEFFRTLGRPEDAAGYDFSAIGENETNKTKLALFKDLALSNNLTKSQAEKMAKSMLEQDKASADSAADQKQSGIDSLKGDWGHAYDQNMRVAAKVARATGAPDAIAEAIEAGNADPAFTKWMYSLASKFEGEGKNLIVEGETKVDTPEEIRAQISEIMNNREHPYYVANHPDHAAALNKMIELQRKVV